MKKMTLLLVSIMFVSQIVSVVSARSLWSPSSKMNFLLTDANASKVGEILTIIVQEDNRANDTADSEGGREHNMSGLLGTIFNNRFMDKVFGDPAQAPALEWQSSNQFTGESEVDRSNQFNSRIAATIVRIDQAGNYLVEARKTIRVGEENKTIILSGKVRPRDIINNTVLSYKVADAEISYLGDGTISKYNNPNIFQRFLNFLF